MKTRRYRVTPGGGISSLRFVSEDIPEPVGRQVLVRVAATSINYREKMIILEGRYPLGLKPDLIPISDGAGEIVAIGPQATRFRVGDRVAASVFARWIDGPFSMAVADQLGGSLDGMLTEYTLLDEDSLVAIPPHLSYEEAAAFPCAGVTAWNALTSDEPILPGHTVLVLGSGSVSLFALQFAKLFGAAVIATTSSAKKADLLKGLGVDHAIDYKTARDWEHQVRTLTNGIGVDRIIEVGGASTLKHSIASLALDGRIALVGALGGGVFDPAVLYAGVYAMRRIALGSRAHFLAMNRAVTQHALRPIIDRTFEFNAAADALGYAFKGVQVGKVVIRING